MKPSRYNFFLPFQMDNYQVIAYNALTNSLAVVEKDKYEKLTNFINNHKEIDDEDFLDDLKKGGYLIEDDEDELKLIKYRMLNTRYSDNSLSLTIAPTLNCNFECIYCYEKNSRGKLILSDDIQNKIIQLVKDNQKYIESLDVTWYGGEPLLTLEIIEDMSKKFMTICKENNIRYSASMVTNGFNLSKETAIKLRTYSIDSVQVTLDGPPEIHNKKRPLVGRRETFDVILKNITECVDIFKNVAIRINTDIDSKDTVYELLNILRQNNLQHKVSIYLGYVEPSNNCYNSCDCLKFDDFASVVYQFENKLVDTGFSKDLTQMYPKIKHTYCGADYKKSYVIDPEGYLYKCWTDIGIEEYRIGHIDSKINEKMPYSKRLFDFMLYDPTEDEKCRECSILPICMGGCPRKRLDQSERCVEYKYSLDLYIKEIAASLYKGEQENKMIK